MSAYRPTIGLEIHAELKTATKMFCACRNNPDGDAPNLNVCPVCMAHPGTLPAINKEAVRSVLKIGKAIGATLADYTEFDRKNYFYPDIPKGYQISQYKYPLVSGGSLGGVAITRVHLEEDTASSEHKTNKSLINYNRAGVPLMELVTEPVIQSAEEAGAFGRELQLLLRCLGVSEANMEKGEMRVEANISVHKEGEPFGTKVEIKNLNSFRAMERAVTYEIGRQIKLLEQGEKVVQETRGWDENKQVTFSQRKKESSHDYRYFPDPDLPSLKLSEMPTMLDIALPELPWQRRQRYLALGLKPDDAEMFMREPRYGDLFDVSIEGHNRSDARIMLSANYIANDLAGQNVMVDAPRFKQLITMVAEKTLSSRGAKDVLAAMQTDAREPSVIAQALGLVQQNDSGTLEAIAQKVIDANSTVVADYRAGKQAALQFLVGQGMKESKGSANPQALREAMQKMLG